MHSQLPEPWLRGPLADVPPLLMPLFHSFQQVREDLRHHTSALTFEKLWTRPAPQLASAGFHLKHIAGSIDRLATYLMGLPLTPLQFEELRTENDPDAPVEALLDRIDQITRSTEERLRSLDLSEPFAPRSIGRRQLPTTVIGLLVHIAEHTQRHTGQAITTAGMVLRAAAN